MLTDSPAPVPQPSHTSQGISLPALRCFAPQGMWPGDASSSGRRCEVGLGKKRAKRSEHLHGKSGGWRQPSSGFPEHEAALSWGQRRCSLSPALLPELCRGSSATCSHRNLSRAARSWRMLPALTFPGPSEGWATKMPLAWEEPGASEENAAARDSAGCWGGQAGARVCCSSQGHSSARWG